jgi:hypothetical protein
MTIEMPELHVGRGTGFGPLTVFPVWTGAAAPAGLVTGQGARVDVAERANGPSVGELRVTNVGDRVALLVEGELLEGGWQHRALIHDVLLSPGASMAVAVACVESGRWGGSSPLKRRSRRASASVRAALSAGSPGMQADVWQRIGRYGTALGGSATQSYVDHLDRLAGPGLPRAAGPLGLQDGLSGLVRWIRQLPLLPGQRGVIAGIAGQPVSLELYPSKSALAAHVHEALTGLLLDAVASGAAPEAMPSRRARLFASRLDGIHAEARPSVNAGAGTALGVTTKHIALSGVSLAGRWAHLTVLNRHHPLLEIA